jgi:ribosomal protein S18 acetylase RimI-like enzyme
MGRSTTLSFDHDDRRRIYEFVERQGRASTDEIRDATNIDPRGLRHHVAILKRDGHLVEADDGSLEVAFGQGATEEHRSSACSFAIRPATQADLSGLVGAIRRVATEEPDIVAETVADLVDREEVLLRHNEVESRMFFVATVDEEVVGWAHLRAPELEKLAHTAKLTVGVLPEYRRCDVGSHLLERAVNWARDRGYEKLYNSVPATNEGAIDFLSERGWDTEAVREDHYRIDEEFVDEVMMATWLRD